MLGLVRENFSLKDFRKQKKVDRLDRSAGATTRRTCLSTGRGRETLFLNDPGRSWPAASFPLPCPSFRSFFRAARDWRGTFFRLPWTGDTYCPEPPAHTHTHDDRHDRTLRRPGALNAAGRAWREPIFRLGALMISALVAAGAGTGCPAFWAHLSIVRREFEASSFRCFFHWSQASSFSVGRGCVKICSVFYPARRYVKILRRSSKRSRSFYT